VYGSPVAATCLASIFTISRAGVVKEGVRRVVAEDDF
jgi:hypothetical protein